MSSRERWLFWWSGRRWGLLRLLGRAARKQAAGLLPQGLGPPHVPPGAASLAEAAPLQQECARGTLPAR